MEALIFIVRTLLQVLLVTVFLLRVLLPLVRADSRNQLVQAVIRLTNPLVMPLRKVLPPIGKADTASIVALLLVQAAATAILLWLATGHPFAIGGNAFIRIMLVSLIGTVLLFYTYAILLYILLSWVAPGTYSPAASLLERICEPILQPVRRVIPLIAGLDLSALFVIIALQALYIAIN